VRESKEAKRRRAAEVIHRLDAHMPNARIELDYRSPLELLISVILSAQCTDKRVNIITPALFARYPTAQAYASASPAELEEMIRTCGLFRSKAKNIIAAAQAIVREHSGQVPHARGQLEALPGVGRKSAGVVTIHLGGEDALPVDTHIRRLAFRLGFTRQLDPDKVEMELRDLLPVRLWAKAHQLLIWHGRRTCFARSPACDRCVVAQLCPRIGLPRRKPAARLARPSAVSSAS
jgi:endonuclease-3